MLHELSGKLLEALVPAVGEWGGVLHYSWVVIAIPALLVLAALLCRWFFSLEPTTRWCFALAALLFVGGAVGVEMTNAAVDEAVEGRNLRYALGTALEEALEFAGVLVFQHALIARLARQSAAATIRFEQAETGTWRTARHEGGGAGPVAANRSTPAGQPGKRSGSLP